MALVPFHVSGSAASQDLEERLLLVGPHRLLLRQRPRASGNTAHLQRAAGAAAATAATTGAAGSSCGGRCQDAQGADQQQQQQQPDLSNVGLVLWQSGYLLADFLLLRHHHQQQQHQHAAPSSAAAAAWAGARVLELGCGGGTVGMFLARAGAHVVLTDQARILELTRENVGINFAGSSECSTTHAQPEVGPAPAPAADSADGSGAPPPPGAAAAFAAVFNGGDGEAAVAAAAAAGPDAAEAVRLEQAVFAAGPLVVEYSWGEPLAALQGRMAAATVQRLSAGSRAAAPDAGRAAAISDALTSFDVISGADLLYDPAGHAPLLDSLAQLTARSPAAQVWLAWRCRALGEDAFERAAVAAGWHVEAVPAGLLHPEFQDGATYRLVCMVRLPP